MRLFLKRKFPAGHYLQSKNLTPEENLKVYGKCKNLHGHTWGVNFEVEGNVDDVTGMVVNFSDLKILIDEFNHKMLNDYLELPTAENLVEYFMKALRRVGRFSFIRVRVYESENAYAEDDWATS